MENQDIREIIHRNQYKLLGEILISKEEREQLKNYVGIKLIGAIRENARKGCRKTQPTPDLKFVLGLTQVVIEGYDGSFWDTLAKFARVKNEDGQHRRIDEILQKRIGDQILLTLQQEHLFWLPPEETPFKYAENLKCQALVPDKFMSDWFDFWYDYYRRNLLYSLDDFTDDDIAEISAFMRDTLQGNEKQISFGWGRKPRSYQLLIATRRVLAYCSGTAVPLLIRITLQMIDSYVHFQRLPDPEQEYYGRFERGFVQWTEILKQREPVEHTVRRLYSQSPYLFLDGRDRQVKLLIPQQRFPASEAKSRISGTLTIGGQSERFELSTYRAFGRYITEESQPYTIADPFAEITVCIDGKTRLRLPEIPYRLFQANDTDLNLIRYRPANRPCYLLCPEDASVHPAQGLAPLDLPGFQGYQIDPEITDEIFVNGLRITRTEQNGNTICYPSRLTKYHASAFDKTLVCCAEHPVITLNLTDTQLKKAYLEVGELCLDSTMLERYVVSDDEEMHHIEVDLSDRITADGVYRITLKIQGEKPDLIGSYCLLHSFSISTAPPFCLPDQPLTVRVGHTTEQVTAAAGGSFRWQSSLKGEPVIQYDLPVIRWGRTLEEIDTCPTQIWHKELGTMLCVCFPGAKELDVCIGETTIQAICLDRDKDLFRAELTEVLGAVEASPLCSLPVHVKPTRSFRSGDDPAVKLFSIIRRTYTKPEPVLKRTPEGTVLLTVDDLVGQDALYMDVCDAQTGALCIEKLRIHTGQNIMEGLDPTGIYTLHRYMLERGSVFSKTEKRTEYHVIQSRCIDPDDPLDTVYRLAAVCAGETTFEPSVDVRITLEEPCGEDVYRGRIEYRRSEDIQYLKLGNAHRFRIVENQDPERLVQMLPEDDFNTICLLHSNRMLLRKSSDTIKRCRSLDYSCLSDEGVILRLVPHTGKELDV